MGQVLVCHPERHISRLVEVNLKRQGYDVQVITDPWSVVHTLKHGEHSILAIGGEASDQVIGEVSKDPSLMGNRIINLETIVQI